MLDQPHHFNKNLDSNRWIIGTTILVVNFVDEELGDDFTQKNIKENPRLTVVVKLCVF